jgi:hypothetical protein
MSERPTSYPPAVNRGDKGQPRETYRRGSRGPWLVYANSGTRPHYLATGASTGPSSGCTGESVAILHGRTWTDTRPWPGDWARVPEVGVDAFKNGSGAPASMRLHFAPARPERTTSSAYPKWAAVPRKSAAPLPHHDTFCP